MLSHDDLLTQLADALAAEDSPARVRMQRWRIVLVDEFQDTDPVQWQVLDRAFSGHATMVLIGDPKQAIYAFRGGDVTTYLTAAQTATTRTDLDGQPPAQRRPSCWSRSRPCSGGGPGDERIVVRDVTAHHQGAPGWRAPPAPFRVRVVRRTTFRRSGRRDATVGEGPAARRADLAHDIRRLLASEPTFRRAGPAQRRRGDLLPPRRPRRRVGLLRGRRPGGDRRRRQRVRDPAAVEWLALLEALSNRSARVRSAAALTCFLGHRRRLAARGDDLTDESATAAVVVGALHPGARVARPSSESVVPAACRSGSWPRSAGTAAHGPAAISARCCTRSRSPSGTGAVALLAWLREQVARARRARCRSAPPADSDAAAVQLGDDPRQQGLEYPVVYVPCPRRPASSQSRSARSSTTTRGGAASTSAGPVRTGPSTAAAGPTRRPAVAAAALRRADPGAEPGGRMVGADPNAEASPAPPAAAPARRGRLGLSLQVLRRRRCPTRTR